MIAHRGPAHRVAQGLLVRCKEVGLELVVTSLGIRHVADVEVEIESGDIRLRAVTDADGRAIFEVCADEVGDARVYLIEGGFPMSATPSFEDDSPNPKEAKATVVVC